MRAPLLTLLRWRLATRDAGAMNEVAPERAQSLTIARAGVGSVGVPVTMIGDGHGTDVHVRPYCRL